MDGTVGLDLIRQASTSCFRVGLVMSAAANLREMHFSFYPASRGFFILSLLFPSLFLAVFTAPVLFCPIASRVLSFPRSLLERENIADFKSVTLNSVFGSLFFPR